MRVIESSRKGEREAKGKGENGSENDDVYYSCIATFFMRSRPYFMRSRPYFMVSSGEMQNSDDLCGGRVFPQLSTY